MRPNEAQIIQFRGLVKELLTLCEEQGRAAKAQAWLVEDTITAIRNLERLDEQIRDQTLPPSKGMSLGLSKAIGEWGIANLYDLAGRIDDYYAHVWNW